MAAIKAFKSIGVLVFADYMKKEYKLLPSGTKSIKKESGKVVYPKIYVLSSNGKKGIKGISYETLKKDTRKAARELRKMLKANPSLVTPREVKEKPETTHEPALLAESQTWKNHAGKPITAAVKSVNETHVTFLGKEVHYPLAQLSTESQEKLQNLQ